MQDQYNSDACVQDSWIMWYNSDTRVQDGRIMCDHVVQIVMLVCKTVGSCGTIVMLCARQSDHVVQ